jgi:hypothetical protein
VNETKMKHPDNEEEDQGNGQGDGGGHTEIVPKVGEKRKDKGKGTTTSAQRR